MDHELLNLLPVLMPLSPLIGFFLIVLFTKRVRWLSHTVAVLSAIIPLVCGVILLANGLSEGHHLADHPFGDSTGWLPIGLDGLDNWFRMGTAIDPLTLAMLFFVPIAIFCIFLYSVGYMGFGTEHADRHYSRFFAFLCLFAAGMFTLVVADNLLLLFVGWEVMGLCSYLLIGFWYDKKYPDPNQVTPKQAAVKAFITTRIGDVLMLLGIAYLYTQTGTLNFADILRNEHTLEILATTGSGFGISAAGLIGLLLFCGTVGKSAQFPLHVWLPDAMEGPTPVSAMIHSAAMVSAGVYMVVRMFPLLSAGWHPGGAPTAPMIAMGLIGAFTALFASTIALAQNDIKRVLAYSTIAQLGYMVAALGVGAYIAAAFHLVTHAFFKALLFLGSGSVIHGMEHGAHHVHDHHTDPQDMMNMGGLRHKMPWTFWTFLIGGLALSGLPLVTAGFWSKDEILAESFSAMIHGEGGFNFLGGWVFIVLAISAALTAFYTMRQIALTFLGKPRTKLAEHAHESTWTMVVPLVILAFFAVTAGFVGIPEDFPVLGPLVDNNLFHHTVGASLIHEHHAPEFNIIPLFTSVGVVLLGLGVGYAVYAQNPLKAGQPDPLEKPFGGYYGVLKNKYYFDEFYQAVFVEPTKRLARWVYDFIDRTVIDGILHTIGRTTEVVAHRFREFDVVMVNGSVDWFKDGFLALAREFRTLQAGKIQEYMVLSIIIAWAFAALLIIVLGR